MPAPPANLAEVLEEAGKRMAAANKLLLLLTASVQLQQGGVGGGGEAEASASSSLEVKLRPMLTLLSETYRAQKAQKALRGTPLYQGNVLGATAPAMEALRKLSASHRTTHQGTKEESAAAQMIIDDDGWGYAIECMWGGLMRKTANLDTKIVPIEESVTIARCGLELAEEVLFRTRPPPPSSFAAEKEARLLIRLLLALDTKYLDESRSHAAAAGAIQHLLTRPNEQRRLATIYQENQEDSKGGPLACLVSAPRQNPLS